MCKALYVTVLMKCQTNFLQLLVYCTLTSINPMLDCFLNGINVLIPNTVADINVLFTSVGIGQIPNAAEIVCVLTVAVLLFAGYRVGRCFLRTLKFFLRILFQFLCVFCACYLAQVVYNDHNQLIWFGPEKFCWSKQPSWLTAEENSSEN